MILTRKKYLLGDITLITQLLNHPLVKAAKNSQDEKQVLDISTTKIFYFYDTGTKNLLSRLN